MCLHKSSVNSITTVAPVICILRFTCCVSRDLEALVGRDPRTDLSPRIQLPPTQGPETVWVAEPVRARVPDHALLADLLCPGTHFLPLIRVRTDCWILIHCFLAFLLVLGRILAYLIELKETTTINSRRKLASHNTYESLRKSVVYSDGR